jgi:hypothetical protein
MCARSSPECLWCKGIESDMGSALEMPVLGRAVYHFHSQSRGGDIQSLSIKCTLFSRKLPAKHRESLLFVLFLSEPSYGAHQPRSFLADVRESYRTFLFFLTERFWPNVLATCGSLQPHVNIMMHFQHPPSPRDMQESSIWGSSVLGIKS